MGYSFNVTFRKKKRKTLFYFLFLGGLVPLDYVNAQNISDKREFRGVWVATLANIDWPKNRMMSAEQQKTDLRNLFDAYKKAGINAVILQIRSAADALYGKGREPWTKWISGVQGKAPVPFYDPLEFAIEEAHKRGMELHAWFNPYRATTNTRDEELADNHIAKVHPDWLFQYGNQKHFDPGLPQVRQYILDVILDVVRNYEIDGVHLDDYFYPYPISGQQINDSKTFLRYGKGFSNIEDWRRENVNMLVKMLNNSIHVYKPHIKFGVSPSGIWANSFQNPDGSLTRGGDSYYQIYADSRKWIKNGWIDYISPQIYRPIKDPVASFSVLLKWWNNNSFGKHLYIGHGLYRIEENKLADFRLKSQFPDQIRLLRKEGNVRGSVFYSSTAIIKNVSGFTDSLKNNYYRTRALPPVMPWLDRVSPNSPRNVSAKQTPGGILLNWIPPLNAKDSEPVKGYVVYRSELSDNQDILSAKNIINISFLKIESFFDETAKRGKTYTYIVTSVDQVKNESIPSEKISIRT